MLLFNSITPSLLLRFRCAVPLGVPGRRRGSAPAARRGAPVASTLTQKTVTFTFRGYVTHYLRVHAYSTAMRTAVPRAVCLILVLFLCSASCDSTADYNELFEVYDTDGNGEIDLAEFAAFQDVDGSEVQPPTFWQDDATLTSTLAET